MKAIIILSLLLCFSCTKKTTLTKDAMGLHISDVQMGISHLNEIEWMVGSRKDTTISQSFTFMVDMPAVSEEDLDYFTEQKGVNAWMLRLVVMRGSERQDLGSLYAPFRAKKVVRGGRGGGAPTNVSLKVYYAAAFASERFRMMKCPPFGHNKRIDSMKIKGENDPIELSIGQSIPYLEKSQLVELAPSSFNAGNSLVGEYFVEIAPYDYKNKITLSQFKRIPQYIEVATEETLPIKGCEGKQHTELDK